MKVLKNLEKILEGLFKGLPPLPENFKKWLAENAWIFAVIGVVLSGISGLLLLTGAILVSTVVSPAYVDSLYAVESTTASRFVLFAWVALVVVVINIVILLKAIPKLKIKARAGWDLIFLSTVLWLVYDMFNWLQYTRAIGSFVWSLISTAVGFYILFQIREKFSSKSSSTVSK